MGRIMGTAVVRALGALFKKRPVSLLMVGLDGSGKTTVLYKLKLGETPCTVPTIGFNGTEHSVEVITRGKLTMTVWDMGGQDKIRKLWSHYFNNIDAVIFVIDSTDRERLPTCKSELSLLLSDPLLCSAPFVILANKQDLDEAMSPSEVADKLDLYSIKRRWYVQPACAVSGEGLETMLKWLGRALE